MPISASFSRFSKTYLHDADKHTFAQNVWHSESLSIIPAWNVPCYFEQISISHTCQNQICLPERGQTGIVTSRRLKPSLYRGHHWGIFYQTKQTVLVLRWTPAASCCLLLFCFVPLLKLMDQSIHANSYEGWLASTYVNNGRVKTCYSMFWNVSGSLCKKYILLTCTTIKSHFLDNLWQIDSQICLLM